VLTQSDDTLKLALDCVAMLSPRRGIAYGCATTPRDVSAELSVSAGPDGNCPIEHCSFHPRPDIAAAATPGIIVSGFTLVFETPQDPAGLTLTLAAGGAMLRADMRDPRIERNLGKATAELGGRTAFGLLREAAGSAPLADLLRHQGRPLGAFADWMARLPLVRGRAERVGQIAEVEALATATSGELLVMLRAAGGLPREAGLGIAAIGWLRGEAGGLPEPAVLPLADWHGARLPAALAGYARLEPPVLDRLQAVELVVHAAPREGEEAWLRCQPAAATVPELLDAACRTTAKALALPIEAPASAGLELLHQVIARREAAFAPTLAALGAAAPTEDAPAGRMRRLALILGVDDPAAVRLFHVTAEEFERRCDTLLVMGTAADDAAQVFARRGRVGVMVGIEAAQALREAAGRAGILAVDAASYALAVAAGTPEAAFSRPLEAGEVARLLALHAVAGASASLTDSLQRLLRLRGAAPGEAPFGPVPHGWSNRHAAEPVNAHLQRLWMTGGADAPSPGRTLPEPVLHG
jgi:hypothetical protein